MLDKITDKISLIAVQDFGNNCDKHDKQRQCMINPCRLYIVWCSFIFFLQKGSGDVIASLRHYVTFIFTFMMFTVMMSRQVTHPWTRDTNTCMKLIKSFDKFDF